MVKTETIAFVLPKICFPTKKSLTMTTTTTTTTTNKKILHTKRNGNIIFCFQQLTLPKTHLASENRPSKKEKYIPTVHLQVREMLLSGRALTKWHLQHLKMLPVRNFNFKSIKLFPAAQAAASPSVKKDDWLSRRLGCHIEGKPAFFMAIWYFWPHLLTVGVGTLHIWHWFFIWWWIPWSNP